MKYISVQ